MKDIKEYIDKYQVNESLLDKAKEIFGKLKNVINKKSKSLSKEDEELVNDFLWAIDTSELDDDVKKEFATIFKGNK